MDYNFFIEIFVSRRNVKYSFCRCRVRLVRVDYWIGRKLLCGGCYSLFGSVN